MVKAKFSHFIKISKNTNISINIGFSDLTKKKKSKQ